MTAPGKNLPLPPQNRFLVLDALRGFAAMSVAVFHYSEKIIPGGYLAVDFFFALSGFVLAQTYRPRFAQGLSPFRFIRLRILRLLPLHLLGVMIGAVFAAQQILRHTPGHLPMVDFVESAIFNPFLLPNPFTQNLFPLNSPAWSLFFEMAANVLMAVALIKLRLRHLLWVVIAAAVLLVAMVTLFPPDLADLAPNEIHLARSAVDGGFAWTNFHVGVARTLFSFSLGMALAQVPRAAVRLRSIWALPCCLLLVALLAIPVGGGMRLAYDLCVVVLASPMLILVGSRFEPGRLFAPVALFVGEASFALYATHIPLTMAFRSIERHMHLALGTLTPVFLVAALALAWVCARWLDPRARHHLGRLMPARA